MKSRLFYWVIKAKGVTDIYLLVTRPLGQLKYFFALYSETRSRLACEAQTKRNHFLCVVFL